LSIDSSIRSSIWSVPKARDRLVSVAIGMAREFSTGAEELVDPDETFILKSTCTHVYRRSLVTFVYHSRQSGFTTEEFSWVTRGEQYGGLSIAGIPS
jgi:hypothetical protein